MTFPSGIPEEKPLKPFIGIGITTYRDISSAEHGEAVFNAYRELLPAFAPAQVRVWSSKHPISLASDFAGLWRTLSPFKVQEDRGRGAVIEKGNFIVGAEWSRARHGGGSVTFRPEMQNDREDQILINHPYAARTDWLAFFRRLVEVCEPAYAMLHLFTEEEVAADEGEPLERFNAPFAGEVYFTSWRTPVGTWRKPDRWETKARRTYRFLPNLSWANFLGPEFLEQYNPHRIEERSAFFSLQNGGLLFTVTPEISDVAKHPELFSSSRDALKAAFKDGFFRR